MRAMSEMNQGVATEIYTGGMVATNAVLARSAAGAELLIDAPEGVTEWLEARGAKPAALLLTHQHFDHVMDAAKVAEKWGIPIYAWSAYSKDLTLEERLAGATGTLLEVPKYLVTQLLEGEEKLAIEGFPEFGIVHIPGHSPDSIGFHLVAEKLFFGGDILFAGSVGRSDFPNGDGELLVQGIREKLFPLGDAIRVFPGHGPETTVGDERRSNPFCGE